MSNIREVGLFPISRKDQNAIIAQLAGGITYKTGFTPHGMFVLDGADIMWSPELLGFDPHSFKLRATEAGSVVIMNAHGGDIKTVYPYQVREVSWIGINDQVVGESGYMLPKGRSVLGKTYLDPGKLEELLVLAEHGTRPNVEFEDDRYFAIKVDPALKGRIFLRVDFRFLEPKPKWVKDGVVIDSDNKQLIPRRIYHPFLIIGGITVFKPQLLANEVNKSFLKVLRLPIS